MSIKVRRHKSRSPEPLIKEKGACIVCVWQSQIYYTNIFKGKKRLFQNSVTVKIKSLTPYKRLHQVGFISLSYNWVILNDENNQVLVQI